MKERVDAQVYFEEDIPIDNMEEYIKLVKKQAGVVV